MQDLDLDELEQAVTQLMDQPKGKKIAKKAVPAAPLTAEKADEPKPVAAPAKAKSAAEAVVVTTTPAARPLLAPQSRQRMRPGAMDIIQRPAPASAPSRRPNREAQSLQPSKPIAPEPTQPSPVPQAPLAPSPAAHVEVSDDLLASINLLEESNKTVKPKVEAPPAPATEAWPDPIDLHNFDDTPEQKEPESELAEEPPTIQSAPPELAEPAASPFVTTKVEKRPLGAYAAPAPEPEPAAPPEALVPDEDTSKSELAEASLQSNQHVAEPEHNQPEPEDPRQMAIPQQYHTAQSALNELERPVFDTKEYHAPPQPMHTARRGGPGLVIGVVVLIVLIIGVVAVGYLMMTGTLDIRKFW